MIKTKYLIPLIIAGVLLESCSTEKDKANKVEQQKDQPNVLLVVVDDLGFTDCKPYGGEINTPNIDKLADEGVLFTDFHTSVSCSPTRAMLLTGTDNHVSGLGTMGEMIAPNQVGKPGYEGHLNDNVISLEEVLKGAGYQTYMAGKWHLGHDADNIPVVRGFDKSFCLLNGGGSHFADKSGLMPFERFVEYSMNGEKIDTLPKDFYSSKNYTDFLIDAVRAGDNDKPFFAYLAFSAPHDPLHVPEPWMSKYRGQYDEGYEVLRSKRIETIKKLGLIPKDAKIPAMNKAVKSWDSYTDEEKAYESRAMEVYAGMVDNVDYHMGRMLDFLADIDELENTIIIFMSDNGANPWSNTDYPGNADGVFLSNFNNQLENIGNPTSHVAYGAGWASAGSGPLDYFKLTTGEGGIRTPLIISGPGINKGEIQKSFSYVTDIMPTVLNMLNIEKPDSLNGKPVLPMIGKSLSKVLSGESEFTYSDSEYIGGELGNGKWMRKGNYKAQMVQNPYGDNEWKLFDLSVDPGETNDISNEKPELLKELKAVWLAYSKEVGIIAAKR